jgi:hypothetical protein
VDRLGTVVGVVGVLGLLALDVALLLIRRDDGRQSRQMR